MRDAERLAKLITPRERKALPDSRGEGDLCAEFFSLVCRKAVGRQSRPGLAAPALRCPQLVQHKPAGRAVHGDRSLEFSLPDGDRKNGPDRLIFA